MDTTNKLDVAEKTNKPKDYNFYQQTISAWKPILTAKKVFIYFSLCGLICLGLGIGLLIISINITEIEKEYTDCKNAANQTCHEIDPSKICQCEVSFTLDKNLEERVAMYYKLHNFYQNHRYYIRSRDYDQLKGKISTEVNEYCDPYGKDSNGKIYAPCGAIANSMFNDSFILQLKNTGEANTIIQRSSKGIAWSSDSDNFKEVTDWSKYVKPKNWPKAVQDIYPKAYADADDLKVWMRTAALPTFRKLNGYYKDGLKAGTYIILINYHYPVKSFGGRKYIILSTFSFVGGKNHFLGIAYITVGVVQIVLAVIYAIMAYRKRLPVFDSSRTLT